MNFISIARLLFQLFPMVFDAIKAADAAFPAQGSGPSKLSSVLTVLQAAHDAAPEIASNFDEIRKPATDMINGIVAVVKQARTPGTHP